MRLKYTLDEAVTGWRRACQIVIYNSGRITIQNHVVDFAAEASQRNLAKEEGKRFQAHFIVQKSNLNLLSQNQSYSSDISSEKHKAFGSKSNVSAIIWESPDWKRSEQKNKQMLEIWKDNYLCCSIDFQYLDKHGRVYTDGNLSNLKIKEGSGKPWPTSVFGLWICPMLSKKATVAALKELQYCTLDGHVTEFKRSSRAENNGETIMTARKTLSKTNEPNSSKLHVRNIPFEAMTKEVKGLLKRFGELKAVRLPKKMAGNETHRRFIDFSAQQDAEIAFDSLSASTHLYGRLLVLEWVASEDTIEDVRRRTTSHFSDGEALYNNYYILKHFVDFFSKIGPPAKRNKKLELASNGQESD